MKSLNHLSIAVMICTCNRPKSLIDCLYSIKRQSILPNHIVLVEKVHDRQSTNKKELNSIFGSDVSITYKKISSGNISVSRNIALNLAKEDILLFIDDDVWLEPAYIEKLLQIYQRSPEKNFVVGKIKAAENNYWQNFTLKLITACLQNEEAISVVLHWPTLNFSFRKQAIAKYHLSFDERYAGLEDIAFCLKLDKLNQKIYYFPNLFVVHKFRNNLSGFSNAFRKYFQNINDLYIDYPQYDVFNRSLYKKSICRPFKLLIDSFQMAKNFKLPPKYFFAAYIHHYLVLRAMQPQNS